MHLIVNGSPIELPPGSRLPELLARCNPEARRVAIELNGAIVPRSRHADTVLNDDDRVEIVQAIGGG
jgi:sulfur carrier protein